MLIVNYYEFTKMLFTFVKIRDFPIFSLPFNVSYIFVCVLRSLITDGRTDKDVSNDDDDDDDDDDVFQRVVNGLR